MRCNSKTVGSLKDISCKSTSKIVLTVIIELLDRAQREIGLKRQITEVLNCIIFQAVGYSIKILTQYCQLQLVTYSPARQSNPRRTTSRFGTRLIVSQLFGIRRRFRLFHGDGSSVFGWSRGVLRPLDGKTSMANFYGLLDRCGLGRRLCPRCSVWI